MSRTPILLSLLLSVPLAFLGCTVTSTSGGNAPAAPPPDPAETADSLREARRELDAALIAGDWEAVAAAMAPDVVLLPPDREAVSGEEAVLENMRASRGMDLRVTDVLEVRVREDLAYLRGQLLTIIVLPGGEAVSGTGKFLEIWRRDAEGRWLLSRSMWNLDDAADEPEGPGTER